MLLKLLHLIIGHKEELTEQIETQNGTILLYTCKCGTKRWTRQYHLSYLSKTKYLHDEITKLYKEEHPVLSDIKWKKLADK